MIPDQPYRGGAWDSGRFKCDLSMVETYYLRRERKSVYLGFRTFRCGRKSTKP